MKIVTHTALPFFVMVCNQDCPYCVNHHATEAKLRCWLEPGRRWIDGLNGLDLIDELKTGGGEPTLHPDFVDIFNHVNDVRGRILIGTNGAELAVTKLLRVRPRQRLRVQIGFHPTETAIEPFIPRVLRIREVHGSNAGVHAITRGGQPDPAISEGFRKRGIEMIARPFLYDHEGYCGETLSEFPKLLVDADVLVEARDSSRARNAATVGEESARFALTTFQQVLLNTFEGVPEIIAMIFALASFE